MKKLTILDFALGIALLYHWGADGKEIRNIGAVLHDFERKSLRLII